MPEAIFAKLVPLASRHNSRVVLVNRRDYPASAPYTIEERAVLANAAVEVKTDPLAARAKLRAFMAERAREVYDLLIAFVAQHKIPPARPEENKGGIVIGGWSFGTGWMTSLLANVASFPVHEVELAKYVRRVIFYGAYRVAVSKQPTTQWKCSHAAKYYKILLTSSWASRPSRGGSSPSSIPQSPYKR